MPQKLLQLLNVANYFHHSRSPLLQHHYWSNYNFSIFWFAFSVQIFKMQTSRIRRKTLCTIRYWYIRSGGRMNAVFSAELLNEALIWYNAISYEHIRYTGTYIRTYTRPYNGCHSSLCNTLRFHNIKRKQQPKYNIRIHSLSVYCNRERDVQTLSKYVYIRVSREIFRQKLFERNVTLQHTRYRLLWGCVFICSSQMEMRRTLSLLLYIYLWYFTQCFSLTQRGSLFEMKEIGTDLDIVPINVYLDFNVTDDTFIRCS